MTDPTTAPTPEELATFTIRYRATKEEAQMLMRDKRARILSWDDVFAQRDAAEARATTAEAALAAALGRVTELEAALVPAYEGGVDHAFEAAKEVAAGELAASQARETAMREALTIACTWGIASANFSAAVSLDLRDWFVAYVAGRREPFPADMLKTLSIIDPDLHAAIQPQEPANE